MAYIIYKNTDEILTTLEVGEVDQISTSLDLVGKNVNNYGEFVNQNFVRLLTNFSGNSNEQPRSPQEGQIWYNNDSKKLYVFNGINFEPADGAYVGTAPLYPTTGTLWFDSTSSQLKLYDGNEYSLIGPATPHYLGKIGIDEPPFQIHDWASGDPRYPNILYSNGRYIAAISTETFSFEENTATIMLGVPVAGSVVVEGITIFKNLEVKGNISVQGTNIFNRPTTSLSSYYNITRFGHTNTTNTATNLQRYNDANRIIANQLEKMFPTNTYQPTSEARVLCDFEQLVAVSTITGTVSTGTTTIDLSTTTNIELGHYIEGTNLIPPGSIVTNVGYNQITLSTGTVSSISSGTILTFNTITNTVRRFQIWTGTPVKWTGTEVYTSTQLLAWFGTPTNIVV